MRRLALLGLCTLLLNGCAFKEWDRVPFFSGPDPFAPVGDTENLRLSRGEPVAIVPLHPDTGDIWPGPLPSTPSMADLVKQEQSGQLPGLETLPGQPSAPLLPTPRGSLAAPPPLHSIVPNVPPVPGVGVPGADVSGLGAAKPGRVIQTPEGPGVTSGGTGAFSTITMPNGQTGIVVPNGNGTSTVILGNGQVQTIPSPR